MRKLAFIDHSFKEKSLSSAFFVDRLREDFDVKIFWDESWNGGPRVDLKLISKGYFDVLILFQQVGYYSVDELESLDCSVVLVPMYDADGWRNDDFWYKYRKFKFLNFSKSIHQRLLDMGIESHYCQFSPMPPSAELWSQEELDFSHLKGFFWQRRGEITWNEIKKLIRQADFKKIHIHTAVDPPGYDLVLPSEKDRARYEITTSNWFVTKDEYLKEVAECQVFFAPRLYEGIGMAFLEAMAMGKCVVAPNNPTMNEYITHGYNGLLYNPKDPQPLDFSNIKTICSNARKYMVEGFVRWPDNQRQMIRFIKRSQRKKILLGSVLKKMAEALFKIKK